MDSYWNMSATCTHTKTVTDSVYQRFAEFYHGLVRNEIHIWMKFHMYWLMQQEQQSPPVLVVRFEDLIAQPAKELRRILQFCMQTQNLSPAWQDRVEQVMGSSSNIPTVITKDEAALQVTDMKSGVDRVRDPTVTNASTSQW